MSGLGVELSSETVEEEETSGERTSGSEIDSGSGSGDRLEDPDSNWLVLDTSISEEWPFSDMSGSVGAVHGQMAFSAAEKKKPEQSGLCSDVVGLDGFEPSECHSQSVVPYHLATAQYKEKRLINEVFFLGGVGSGIRTHDLQCHKLTR